MEPIFALRLSRSLLIFSFFVWFGASGAANSAAAFELNADPVSWRRLSYRAKSLFGTVSTRVDLTAVPTPQATGALMTGPAVDALKPAGAAVWVLTVDTDIKPLFGSSEKAVSQSWLDPKDAGALQRVRLRQGKDRWQKTYRFTKGGVFRMRRAPQESKQENLPPGQWTKTKASFYPIDQTARNCFAVLAPSTLLLIAPSMLQNQSDRPLYLRVFNKKQLHQVKVFVDGTRRLKLDYLENAEAKPSRRQRSIDAVKISFQPRALNRIKNEAPEDFSFFGLKGGFDVYIDPDSLLPVQISGRIPTIGKLNIRLVEAEIKP